MIIAVICSRALLNYIWHIQTREVRGKEEAGTDKQRTQGEAIRERKRERERGSKGDRDRERERKKFAPELNVLQIID